MKRLTDDEIRDHTWDDDAEARGDLRISRGSVLMRVPEESRLLRLTAAQVHRVWCDGRLPRVTGLTHFPHCGYHFSRYAEVLIGVDAWGWGEWPFEKPLRFRVGQVLVHVGRASQILAPVMEHHYFDEDLGQSEFGAYGTIRLHGVSVDCVESYVARTCFYLNSHYLKPVTGSASVVHLFSPAAPYPGPDTTKSHLFGRTRVRGRDDFECDEPLSFFNAACSEYGDYAFLGFYRVLEFFVSRAVECEVDGIRFDGRIPTRDLIKSASQRGEESRLRSLVGGLLTSGLRKRLLIPAVKQGLVSARTVEAFTKALYAHRNAVVHAKQEEIRRSQVPDPLGRTPPSDGWTEIARELAVAAIKRLNAVK